MCGVTGFFRPERPAPLGPADLLALRRMTDTLQRRGPDEDATWAGAGVGLGARRLAVIDVAHSHQPQFGPSGRTACVLNGEIYNFTELRRELEAQGHRFETGGDTEVLPHGFEEWGIDGLVRRLNGMFAFALYDGRSRELWLARDRLGIKPLYYGEFGDTWYFGSELKALLAHPDVRREIDLASLSRYLVMEYVPSPRSIYRGVSKLEPGHVLRVDAAGAHKRRYWTMPWRRDREGWDHAVDLPAPGDDVEAAWLPPLLEMLREAVRARLVSDVPIGALLSGGLDSSSVAALMAELVPDLRTFSVGFDEDSFDESRHARAVAAHIGSRHHERRFSADQFPELLQDTLQFLDEPFADGSLLPTGLLSRSVREEGVTVVLSGDGADELFAGYPTYLAQRGARVTRALPGSALVLKRLRRAADSLPSSYDNVTPDYMARRFLGAADLPPARRQVSWVGAFLEEEMRAVLQPDVRAQLGPNDPWSEVDAHHAEPLGVDRLERLLHLDLRTYLADDILVKVDRASMRHSLEVRTPFLDHRLVEMAARIPPGLKLRGTTGKYLLKKAMAPRLPREVVQRKKKGFGLPLARWLRGPYRDLLLDTLGSGGAAATGWFHQPTVDALIDDHLSGRRDRRRPLWTLLIFRLWEDGAFGP